MTSLVFTYMESKSGSYRHIIKYTGLFGGVQGVSILVALVRNKLVALILGPNGMGLMSLFNSTVKLLSDSTNCGIGMSGVKGVSEVYDGEGDAGELRQRITLIRSWAFVTAIAGMVLMIVLSPLLNLWTFNWGNHTLHYLMLSPVVALMAITGGETAILKGLRQLGSLAKISVINVVCALITTVPIYWFFGESGIVPALFVMALVQMVLTVAFSWRLYPLHLSFGRGFLATGRPMLRLGIAFVVAGIMGSGADFLIRSYLNNAASLETLGLYNAGYMMTMTYAGMVFSAMESDYFPRLSSIHGTGKTLNDCVNRQIEVGILIVSPLLAALMVGLPIILPLLFSGKFLPAMGMIQFATLAMYLRGMTLPIAYLPLSKGDSASYLLMESIYDVAVVVLVIVGFKTWGLEGTGVALLVSSMVDITALVVYMRRKYCYRLGSKALKYFAAQFALGIATFVLVRNAGGIAYWLAGIAIVAVSLCVSIHVLRTKTRNEDE